MGNTHSIVPNAKVSRVGLPNEHRWTMFVLVNNSWEETARLVESVTYFLHPSFAINKVKCSESPFLLARVGWAYFDVRVQIDLKKEVGIDDIRMSHELSFEGNGVTRSFQTEINYPEFIQ